MVFKPDCQCEQQIAPTDADTTRFEWSAEFSNQSGLFPDVIELSAAKLHAEVSTETATRFNLRSISNPIVDGIRAAAVRITRESQDRNHWDWS